MICDVSVNYWLAGSGSCVWIRGRDGNHGGEFHGTTGTLRELLLAYLEGKTPIGVVLDRLEECPEEVVGLSPEDVSIVVSLLRVRHPHGV